MPCIMSVYYACTCVATIEFEECFEDIIHSQLVTLVLKLSSLTDNIVIVCVYTVTFHCNPILYGSKHVNVYDLD